MGKFKEIDLNLQYAISDLLKIAVYYLAIVSTIGVFILSADNTKLTDRNGQIEADRTELITENKHLQEENRALKSIAEMYRIPNNSDTREE